MKTKIMGIVNITPDSFYDGGKYENVEKAIVHALKLSEEGADILDIGGESTRPGSDPISEKEELERIIPVIEHITDRTASKISIDTYRPSVAKKAIDAGATMINDITGMKLKEMRELAADEKADVIIMHMQGDPKTMQKNPKYGDVVGDILEFFKERIKLAEQAGVSPRRIIIDPGIGFGKTTDHNLKIIANIEDFKKLKKRVCLGHSRKSFIGRILQNGEHALPPDERLEATLALSAYCALKKVDILRVHDVKENIRALKMIERLVLEG